jgi:disulfide bond formation protein DsbB
MKNFFRQYSLLLAWATSLVATLGSLYYSNVLNLPPCVLCWYQRIAIYPLVIFLAVAIQQKNKRIHLYVLPLTLIGMAISIYHNLLYYNIIPESLAPCVSGVSCTTRLLELFGFLTIPTQALIGFVLINLFLIIHWRLNKDV